MGVLERLPDGEKPREKLLARGAGALSDRELLAVLLGVGPKGMVYSMWPGRF